ncbi:uncharacterized protein EKO05_0004887 [Ascochyta rabiei]|uniref:Catalytic n=1 Tax=Didymella rabiei TaxID=5454 RepID=A0A163LKC2_DIDRA|nr:uncharacterized protein EKO05_0004887 [Ascochyta rabiei]KZM27866.1 catalytic [Ascochyta rabiei]UPX14404.1 hypothetical protein EKO05_0004887 [Ascochyta rabiei]
MPPFTFPALSAGPPSRRNWYKELLDDPACRGNASRVQEAYKTHRDSWRAKQIELFNVAVANPVTPDQALIKHLAYQKRLQDDHDLNEGTNTDVQEVNCCVIWARPPPAILDTIQTIQKSLARLVGNDLYTIPRKDLHLSMIELSHRHSVQQLCSVAEEIGTSRIQEILNLVSTFDKPELVTPQISFDKMGIALNFLPSDKKKITYHHLRSDMHAMALDSGIGGIDMCYTAPSAHVTIGRFIGNDFFEKSEARKKFVQLMKDLNTEQVGEDASWVVGETQGLELQLGYLKFGREREKADMVGTV